MQESQNRQCVQKHLYLTKHSFHATLCYTDTRTEPNVAAHHKLVCTIHARYDNPSAMILTSNTGVIPCLCDRGTDWRLLKQQ